MQEIVLQNPVIAIVVITTIVVGVAWRVLIALYVTPRDFRIESLEKKVADLRDEAIRRQEQSAAVIGAMPQTEEPKNESQGTAPLSRQKTTQTAETPPAQTGDATPLTSISTFYREWRDKAKTDLQRLHFERGMTGQRVGWRVFVDSVEEFSSSRIWLYVTDTTEVFSDHRACAEFPSDQQERLLALQKGDSILLTGVIHDFFMWPKLKECNFEKQNAQPSP